MKGRRFLVNVFLLIGILMLAGCSSDGVQGESKPDKIHHVFLMFEEKYTGEYDESIGDLFLVSEDGDKEKISSDVKDGFYSYINSQDKVLFINQENELYEFENGKEKVKIAKDVSNFDGDYREDIVTYQNSETDLYIINGENEEEKISSTVSQYELIGEHIYFLDNDGDLSKYNINDHQETEIDSDVFYFTSLSDKEEIAYLDDDYSLFYKKAGDEDSIKITSDEVAPGSIIKVDSNLVYYNVEDEDSTELYLSAIAKGGESKKVASDVRDFQYNKGYFYYINDDDNLYKRKENEEKSTKLASDISMFTVKDGSVIYMDQDQKLFKHEGDKDSEKVGSSVSQYDVTPKGEIVYQTDDQDLYVNGKKVASDVGAYHQFFGNLVYSSDDQLYLMENMSDKKVIEDDLDQFSNAYYQNGLVYSNLLTFEDIAGVWRADYEGDSLFIEIKSDGTFVNLQTGETDLVENDYSGYRYISASSEGSSMRFSLGEDQTLSVDVDGNIQIFTQSKKADAEKFYKELELEMDKNGVSYLMEQYISNFHYAVNSGSAYYIQEYIDPASAFYKEQTNFVESTYEKNIREDLVDYKIDSINNSADGVYNVNCTEVYTIYSGDDYEGKTKTFKNSYTVKKINDQFFITGVKVVSQENADTL